MIDLLPEDLLAEDLAERIRSGKISKIVAIGQGTAAVAAQSFVAACRDEFQHDAPSVTAMVASELSGFAMDNDMSDHLIVAISQSGTTTDTNRTVDLAKSRGAAVIAIVNRRNSDLTDRADAVFYTSDGRDVEMSVASTKAFYSQIVAGFLLAFNLAGLLGLQNPNRQRILSGLQQLPDTLTTAAGASQRNPRSRPSRSPRNAATGQWWAAAETASPQKKCASSSQSSATNRFPATA